MGDEILLHEKLTADFRYYIYVQFLNNERCNLSLELKGPEGGWRRSAGLLLLSRPMTRQQSSLK